MKNVFYFTLKAIFVLDIFQFLSSLYGQLENGLIRSRRLILEFMTSQTTGTQNCGTRNTGETYNRIVAQQSEYHGIVVHEKSSETT